MDPIAWLNDNAGLFTALFAFLTLLTLLETRAARIATTGSAHVAFRPDIDPSAGTTLRLRLRNHGPAVADDVRMRMQWFEGDSERSPLREMVEPVLGAGDDRLYIPDLLLETDRRRPMKDLGGFVLRVEWSWLDERRWLFAPWLRMRGRRTLSLDVAAFTASVHGGPLILERETLAEEVRGVGEQLRKMNDRATRDEMKGWKTPAEVKAQIERYAFSEWLAYQRELWTSRLRMWTRRRR